MTALARRTLIEKLPGWGAAAGAVSFALAAVMLPGAWLEASGIAALLPSGAVTQRAVLAFGGGALTATVVWAALYVLFGRGGFFAPRPALAAGAPVVRRADAHPDAPSRRPLFAAAELTGAPASFDAFAAPEPDARAVPVDLDTPLSALDPAAIPSVPREPVRPVAPLAHGERLHAFTLTPPAPPAGDTRSIDTLLERLERGTGRRTAAG